MSEKGSVMVSRKGEVTPSAGAPDPQPQCHSLWELRSIGFPLVIITETRTYGRRLVQPHSSNSNSCSLSACPKSSIKVSLERTTPISSWRIAMVLIPQKPDRGRFPELSSVRSYVVSESDTSLSCTGSRNIVPDIDRRYPSKKHGFCTLAEMATPFSSVGASRWRTGSVSPAVYSGFGGTGWSGRTRA